MLPENLYLNARYTGCLRKSATVNCLTGLDLSRERPTVAVLQLVPQVAFFGESRPIRVLLDPVLDGGGGVYKCLHVTGPKSATIPS